MSEFQIRKAIYTFGTFYMKHTSWDMICFAKNGCNNGRKILQSIPPLLLVQLGLFLLLMLLPLLHCPHMTTKFSQICINMHRFFQVVMKSSLITHPIFSTNNNNTNLSVLNSLPLFLPPHLPHPTFTISNNNMINKDMITQTTSMVLLFCVISNVP